MGSQLTRCGCICGSGEAAAAAAKAKKQGSLGSTVPPNSSSIQTELQSEAGGAAQPSSKWVSSRVKGTPVMDEGFICMGGRAPICPPPAEKPTGPVTLEVLQGDWLGSSGSRVTVLGTDVNINGMPLNGHKVELKEDGTVVSIGRLWQLKGWAANGTIEWKCSSTQDNMESARSDLWTKKSQAAGEWKDRMQQMGYAGSAANPLTRGVEGCIPGTSGAEMAPGHNAKKDAEECALLQALVSQWREGPQLCKVRSRDVVPDFTNRAQTGLGVELMHYVAGSIRQKGFQKRKGMHGHDIPVLVREPVGTATSEEALRVWRERVSEEEGFPPVRAGMGSEEIFTSLGNGHFFQALNLYDTQSPAINEAGVTYSVGKDAALAEALEQGVPSIVLRNGTPRPVRAKIAALLNSKREFMWTLGEDGSVDIANLQENEEYCSQFEWLSKGMDAEQVNCLVRTHLGVTDSKRIKG